MVQKNLIFKQYFMKNKIYKITEQDLHRIIMESVNEIMECDCGGVMGAGATSTQITPDGNAAGYTPVYSGIMSRKFQKPAMTKNKNGSVSIPDKRK